MITLLRNTIGMAQYRRGLSRLFVALCSVLLISACTQAVQPAAPDPEPVPQPTLLGTWETIFYGHDDEGNVDEMETVTLRFTETHFFEWNHVQDANGRTRHKYDQAGTVIHSETSVTKTFVDDDRVISVPKDFILAGDGNILLIHHWGDDRPTNGFDRFIRVADAPTTTEPLSLWGTWQRYTAWEDDEDGWIEQVVTLTLTGTRFIEHIVRFDSNSREILDTWSEQGGWSDNGTTVTKIFFEDEQEHPVDKHYVIVGDLLAVDHWGAWEPLEELDVFTRVQDPVADLAGRWVQDFEDEDEAWSVSMTVGADGSFRRVYSLEKTPDEDRLKSHEITGTYELDTAEKFILVTITSTVGDGELWLSPDYPFWSPGERLRFAYAPSNDPNLIVMSMPWWEQRYDRDQGMKVDRPENRYGAYWDRLTKVE